jgi:hypothetical protein
MQRYSFSNTIQVKSILLVGEMDRRKGYFCDGTHRIAVPEVLSQKDANRIGVRKFFLTTVY